MEEAFLHFLWKYQHFKKPLFQSSQGEEIVIFHPGTRNTDAGPDFLNARIKISEITWNGHVEIHVNSSDWNAHGHHHDKNYDNVILHVVWVNNSESQRSDGNTIPALELKNIVKPHLYVNYRKLLEPKDEILCRSFINNINPLTIINMADRAITGRLQAKAGFILRELSLAEGNWEEVAWRMVCRNFGFRINADCFFELGKSLPFKILKKESGNAGTIEALLFGQAGFLDTEPSDDYQSFLKKEYLFKSKKHRLEKNLDQHRWKFLRLRPANFPTIRIAQLAAIVQEHPSLFSFLTDFEQTADFQHKLSVRQSAYWNFHYRFGEKTSQPIGGLGVASVQNIMINTVIPLIFALGINRDDEMLKEKALRLTAELPAESNNIIAKWKTLGLEIKSAFDSQAFLELYKEYCLRKGCLNCAIGAEIIRAE